MSFINLRANDLWSEADILRRTEAIIRSEFSLDEETVLNRKATATVLGQYNLSEQDLVKLEKYRLVTMSAQAEGAKAREDMVLLIKVLDVENGEASLEEAEPEVVELFNLRNTITE